MRCDAFGNDVRLQIGTSIEGTIETRRLSNGIVIALKATESQIVICIINDDMRICSTVAEGVLFKKSYEYASSFKLAFCRGSYHRYSPKPLCWPGSQFSRNLLKFKFGAERIAR